MAKKQVVHKYVGLLDTRQAAAGIQAALENARSLLADANLLLQQKRCPRAASLAILAVEEAGKPPLIRSLLLAQTESEAREEWKAYRNHSKKNYLWILPDLAARGARLFDELRDVADPDSDHPDVLDAIKQVGFYSDAFGERCNWSLPDHAISEREAQMFVELARRFVRDKTALTSEAELKLWVKHMRPVWKRSDSEMKHALAACYAEAQELGVLTGDVSAGDMVRFLF